VRGRRADFGLLAGGCSGCAWVSSSTLPGHAASVATANRACVRAPAPHPSTPSGRATVCIPTPLQKGCGVAPGAGDSRLPQRQRAHTALTSQRQHT